jgi:hypothetical protein
VTARLVAPSLALACALALLAACGGGDNTSPSATPSAVETTVTAPASGYAPTSGYPPGTIEVGTPGPGKLCSALSPATITGVTGWSVSLQQPHSGPGFLVFCTIYLDVPGCEMQCALSLEELGTIDPSSNNSAEAFRASLTGANADTQFQFEDGVLGADSWLATATSGDLPAWKVLYFVLDGTVAYDLSSPRAAIGLLTRDQMIALARSLTVRTGG